MEWTTLFKTNHHFLKPSIGADHDTREDQSAPPLAVFRRNESVDCSSSGAHDDNTAAAAAVAAATARRAVSISRSGRYKSKTKHRVRLFNNGIDIAANTTHTAATVTTTLPAVVNPSTIMSDDQPRHTIPQQDQDVSSPSTAVEAGKSDNASNIKEVSSTASVTAADAAAQEPPAHRADDGHVASPSAADVCAELSLAEQDESTDL